MSLSNCLSIFRLGVLAHHLQLGLGGFQFVARFFDGELIALQLQSGHDAPRGQTLGGLKSQLRAANALFGHEDLAQNRLLLLAERAFQVLQPRDLRRPQGVLRLDHHRVAGVAHDLLLDKIPFQGRRLQLDQLVPFFDLRAFVDHPDDLGRVARSRFHLALDVHVARTLYHPLFEHNLFERPPRHLGCQHPLDRLASVLPEVVPDQPAAAGDQQENQHDEQHHRA
jgi:hypothetical protein